MPVASEDFKRKLAIYAHDCLKYNIFQDLSSGSDFRVVIGSNYWDFIPHEPTQFAVDDALYDKIFDVMSVDLFPVVTMIKPPQMIVVGTNSDDVSTFRALRFPFYWGTVNRLRGGFNDFRISNNSVPITDKLSWNFRLSPHGLVAGDSGSGKSYFLAYLLNQLSSINGSKCYVVDPKLSNLSILAKLLPNAEPVLPDFSNNGSGISNSYLEVINRKLLEVQNIMAKRQLSLYQGNNTNYIGSPIFVFIDELASLVDSSVNSRLKKEFYGYLGRICLMGRSSNVNLILSVIRPTADVLPVILRNNCHFKAMLGSPTLSDLKLMFSNLDSIPFVSSSGERGSGLCVISNAHNNYVQPIKTPTIVGGASYD